MTLSAACSILKVQGTGMRGDAVNYNDGGVSKSGLPPLLFINGTLLAWRLKCNVFEELTALLLARLTEV
jgi:hypothetical protein